MFGSELELITERYFVWLGLGLPRALPIECYPTTDRFKGKTPFLAQQLTAVSWVSGGKFPSNSFLMAIDQLFGMALERASEAEKTSLFELLHFLSYSPLMHEVTTVQLKRECEAVQIPAGNVVTLPQGLEVDITQTLGGSITVRGQGALFRIAPKDADALGLSLDAQTIDTNAELTEPMIWEALKTCYDPEIPVNIVDLGLVYDMATETLPNENKKVFVKMTLTAPGCGMGPTIARDAQQKLLLLPKVEDAVVEIVWDPPWHQSMITEDGRRILGLE